MSGKGGSFSRTSFHVGTDGRVWCHTYPDMAPIFDIDAGSSSVGISVGRVLDKAAVEFARALANEARKFADEMERMHAAQLADDTYMAAGSDAA
jgi:hypothetical protein